MTHGGARQGAGRKPKFDDRSSVHVYIEEGERQQFLSMIEYMKEVKGDRSISASDTLLDLAQQWMAAIPEDRYLAWAAENQLWLKENYPTEYHRLQPKLAQHKKAQTD